MTNNSTTTPTGLVRCSDGRLRPLWATTSALLQDYYDFEWGRPIRSEQGLFERLCLECFQAGLSWSTILRKRPALRAAFADFDVDTVAQFTEADVQRLLLDASIIRNANKIRAVLTNARIVRDMREDVPFAEFLLSFTPESWTRPRTAAEVQTTCPESKAMARALKQLGFSFVGPTTCFALMEATGMIDNRIVGASGLLPDRAPAPAPAALSSPSLG